MKKINFLAVLLFGVLFSFPVAAKMYKWVDEKGVTHYGETIPPEYADKDRSELNKSGRVVNSRDVLSPEELRTGRAAQEQAEAKRREGDKVAFENHRRDQMLINTYSSVNEIDLARQRNLQQIELRINGILAQVKIINDNLISLQKEADGYSAAKKKIPPSLQEDLQVTQERLDKLKIDLEKPTSDRAALEARYDADKVRYRELTGK